MSTPEPEVAFVLQSLTDFLTNERYLPHGYCLRWDPELVWLHGLSDGLIALSYYSIPLTLIYFVRKRHDLPFSGMLVLFATFILACGTTHALEIWALWEPIYGLEGLAKAVTAGVSVAAAVALIPLAPKVIALRDPRELADVNDKLRREVRKRLRYERAAKTRRRELQRMDSALISAQEETRAAIARDLHDDVKQQLSLLAIDIGMLANDLETKSPEVSKELMGLYESALAATESVREISQQLHPSVLDKIGLSAALEGMVSGFAKRLSVEAEVDIHQTPSSLSGRKSLALYRIAQEALQNISKHSNAKSIRVKLTTSDAHVRLSIEDNGEGFDRAGNRSGLGLGGMRERARAVDGRFTLTSKPGRGTRIIVHVPIGTLEMPAAPGLETVT